VTSTPTMPFGTPDIGPDAIRDSALIDLRAYLTAIARLDPSNTGSDAHDEQRYATRNVLVVQALAAAMAAGLPAGINMHAWQRFQSSPQVFIELPGYGQLSWHLPWYCEPYDGHTTAEKYDRIRRWDEAFRQVSAALRLEDLEV